MAPKILDSSAEGDEGLDLEALERRTRRPAEQRPPRQTADEMIAKNKGTGEAVSDPEEDKQAADPPHHDR